MWTKKRKRALQITIIALVLALIQSLLPSSHVSAAKTHEQEADIMSVVDGDTIAVRIDGKQERVRLIGIDTPESRPNRRMSKQAISERLDAKAILELGAKASAHTKEILPKGTHVRLEYDVQKRDRYGRLLAYVWLPNGTMANEEIVSSGFAYLLTIPPNVKYREKFADAFRKSREEQRGLWALDENSSRPGKTQTSPDRTIKPAQTDGAS